MATFNIQRIGPGDKRGWVVKMDGKEVTTGLIEIESPNFGKLTYGKRPEGYDSWVFAQKNGGGAITIPWVEMNGKLLVGLVLENRPNLSEKLVLCAIGGFIDPGQTAKQAQATEAKEEAGLDTQKAEELPGPAIVSNRLFWNTDVDQGQGDHAFELELSPRDLVPSETSQSEWLLKSDKAIVPKNQANVRFYSWEDAINKTPDALALAALAKLYHHWRLLKQLREIKTFAEGGGSAPQL